MNQIQYMSTKDMERTIFQIMTDNGMDAKTAQDTVDNMSVRDMETYLEDVSNQ